MNSRISFHSLCMSKKLLVALTLPMLALAACSNTTASVTTDDEAVMGEDASDEAVVQDDAAMENDEPVVEVDAEVEAE